MKPKEIKSASDDYVNGHDGAKKVMVRKGSITLVRESHRRNMDKVDVQVVSNI